MEKGGICAVETKCKDGTVSLDLVGLIHFWLKVGRHAEKAKITRLTLKVGAHISTLRVNKKQVSLLSNKHRIPL